MDRRFQISLAANMARLERLGIDPTKVNLSAKLAAFDQLINRQPFTIYAPKPKDRAAGRKVASEVIISVPDDHPARSVLDEAIELGLTTGVYHTRGKLRISAEKRDGEFNLLITQETSF